MTGQRVGNWVLGAELGRGPVGAVFKAHDAEDPARLAAVKVLHPDPARGPEFLAKFPAEMLAFHRLNHPNVVKFYDAGHAAAAAWYAAELVEGTDLGAALKARPKKPDEPGLNWRDEVIPIAVQLVRALKHGHHRSILHRNLKPSNVLLARDGTVKLSDFGVGKLFLPTPLALPADALGTAGFLAPEHFNGKPLTRRSDLYALGGLLYLLVTGRPPFLATTTAEFLHKHCYALPDRPVHFVADLPTDFDDLICALLAKDPARRPGTAAAVIEWLDAVRGKAERKGKSVPWPADPGDASGPMAALPDDATADADEPDARPLMSRPLVVVPLFLLVVGLILTLVFWPRPSADELYNAAQPLLASENPDDWERAWDGYLEELSSRYPDQYADEVAQAKAKIDDRRRLRKALEAGAKVPYKSEAERLYNRGLALAQAGDMSAARRTWEEVARAFAGVAAEERWVKLAEAGVRELGKSPARPTGGPGPAVEQAKKLPPAECNAALDALADLYRDDPTALDVIRAARK